MSDQTTCNALAIHCSESTKKLLCNQFGLPEREVVSLDDLRNFDSRFPSNKFDFIAVDREFLMRSNEDVLANLEKLSALTQSLIVTGPETDQVRTANPIAKEDAMIKSDLEFDNVLQLHDIAALMEHESRNVLQRIQMRTELCKSVAAGNQAVYRNINRIEKEVETLGEFIRTMRVMSRPIELATAQHSLKEIVDLSWRKLVDDKAPGATNDLECEQNFCLDVKMFTMAVDSILAYLLANIEEDSQLKIFDNPVLIDGAKFLEVSFLATMAGGVKCNPQLYLAHPQQIIEAHGGHLELKTSDPVQVVCSVFLPMPADFDAKD